MELVKIADLRMSPSPGRSYSDQVARLVNNIKQYGLVKPITIASDNTVLDGVDFVLAAQILGWTEIHAVRAKLIDGSLRLQIAKEETWRDRPPML